MEISINSKVVVREGKLQLCFSVKGASAMGRSYRVINVENTPDLSTLGSDGRFHGKSQLATEANNAISSAIAKVTEICSNHSLSTLKEFLQFYDGGYTDQLRMTLGDYLQAVMEEQKNPGDTRAHSQGWKSTQNLIRKLKTLKMDKIQMKNVDDSFYEKFCDAIREGKAPDTFHPNRPQDQGCHGYRILTSLLKTLLNKAYKKRLIPSPITYNWHAEENQPVPTKISDQPRMNVPTEDEWQKFLKADLRYYTYANRDVKKLEMMRSIVIVLVETLSRPIDVLTMKEDDISNMAWSYIPTKFKQYPIHKKKTYKRPIGLTNMAYKCVMRYKGRTNAGYVFPFECNMEPNNDENNYLQKISGMGSKINQWLKLMTNRVFSKDVSLYSFRHFAITRALNHGMNVAEVATLAKTSIQQINATYYEKDGVKSMDKLEKLLEGKC